MDNLEKNVEENKIKINILGTEYTILKNLDKKLDKRVENLLGFCDYTIKEIGLSKEIFDTDEEAVSDLQYYENKVLRHEIVHAYLFESGLSSNSKGTPCWAMNEEMVDWIAAQSPKIFKTYKELGIL